MEELDSLDCSAEVLEPLSYGNKFILVDETFGHGCKLCVSVLFRSNANIPAFWKKKEHLITPDENNETVVSKTP